MSTNEFVRPRLMLPLSCRPQPEERLVAARHYLTYEEIVGTKSTIDQLLRVLTTLRRSDVICWSSSLLNAVTEHEGQTAQLQIAYAKDLLRPEHVQKINELTQDGEAWIVFHRRQLWILIQLATITCGEDPPPIEKSEMKEKLGMACLMASDLLKAIETYSMQPPEEPEDNLKWLITLLISITEPQGGEDYVARAHSFWFDSLSDPGVQEELAIAGVETDFDSVFLNKYDVTFTEFFFVIVAFHAGCLSATLKRPISPALVNTKTWAAGTISDHDKNTVLKLLSVRAEDLPGFLLGNPRQSWATDYSPLIARPIIEIFPDQYACVDLSHMRKFLVDGIYCLLESAVGKKKWGNVFGKIYEWYLHKVIASFTVESDSLCRTFYRGPTYQSKGDEACDALMVWNKLAAVCEFKGTRLTTRALSGIDMDETLRAIENSVASPKAGISQLARNVSRICKGERVRHGDITIDLASKRIIPILVWFEEVAVNYATRLHLADLFEAQLKEKGVDSSRVGPLLVLSTRELELFEMRSRQVSAETLLRDYAHCVTTTPRDPNSSFTGFSSIKYGRPPNSGSFAEENLGSVKDKLQKEFERRSATNSIVITEPLE